MSLRWRRTRRRGHGAAELRATEEWKYVDREYDIRVVRIDT